MIKDAFGSRPEANQENVVTTIILRSSFGAIALLLTSYASAATITYVAVLSGANQVPPVATPATGFATLTLNGDALSIVETFSGLIGGAATVSHLHCCAPPGTGSNPASVVFPGFPAATSGSYSATFDLLDPGFYTVGTPASPGFLLLNGGTAASAEAALIAGLNSGQAYVNIHDAVSPGGEIRGNFTIAPEPGTFGLAGVILAFAALIMSRSRTSHGAHRAT
jgi:hypothetical protein